MNILRVIREVLTPGSPEFRAHLSRLGTREAELMSCLQKLDQPVTRGVNASTDEAAEFSHAGNR